jgi:hypothetical protein
MAIQELRFALHVADFMVHNVGRELNSTKNGEATTNQT